MRLTVDALYVEITMAAEYTRQPLYYVIRRFSRLADPDEFHAV